MQTVINSAWQWCQSDIHQAIISAVGMTTCAIVLGVLKAWKIGKPLYFGETHRRGFEVVKPLSS